MHIARGEVDPSEILDKRLVGKALPVVNRATQYLRHTRVLVPEKKGMSVRGNATRDRVPNDLDVVPI